MQSKRTEKRGRWPLVVLLALLCGYLAVELLPGARQLLPFWNAAGDRSLSGVATSPRIRVGSATQITMVTHYTQCGHDEISTLSRPPEPMIGLDAEALRRVYPEWRISEFTEARIVLNRDIDSMCSDDQKYRFVTIRDGRVVVFHGSGRSPSAPLLRETGILVTTLSKADRTMLETGIVLSSDQEVLDWLEGLSE